MQLVIWQAAFKVRYGKKPSIGALKPVTKLQVISTNGQKLAPLCIDLATWKHGLPLWPPPALQALSAGLGRVPALGLLLGTLTGTSALVSGGRGQAAAHVPPSRSPASRNPPCPPSPAPLTDRLTAELTATAPQDWKSVRLKVFLRCPSTWQADGQHLPAPSAPGRARHGRTLRFSFSKAFTAALQRHSSRT